MSKLSDYARSKQKDLSNPQVMKEVLNFLWKRISDCEFTVFYFPANPEKYILRIDDYIVKIDGGARTTAYEIAVLERGDVMSSKVISGLKYVAVSNIENLDGEFIDIQELLIFCKDMKIPIIEENKIENELNEGYKRPQSYVKPYDQIFGKDTLKDDVQYNEWLHKKFR